MDKVQKMKYELVARGVTQNDVAELLNIDPKSVNNKLNGKTKFTVDQWEKVKKTYKINI